MNSPRAQTLIQNVENILWNWDQVGGVRSQEAMDALKRSYTSAYGDVPLFGSNKDN